MNRHNRAAIIQVALGAFAVLIVLKSAHLQLWKGAELATRAERQYFSVDTTPAPRGEFLDVEGRHLVQSLEYLTLAIAPGELDTARKPASQKNRATLEKTLASIKVPAATRRKALNAGGAARWVPIPGRFTPSDLAGIRDMRGVYVTPLVQRASLASAGAQALLGRVGLGGAGEGGLERIFDEELSGEPGLVRRVRSAAGTRASEFTIKQLRAGIPGNSITLTINKDWQGIAEWALADAVRANSASSGDIVIVNPATGEILALASFSLKAGFATTAMVTSPYEPGSSIKPLLAARILELRRADPTDSVAIPDSIMVPGRRQPIRDVHDSPPFLSFHDVIKYSSNIGMVQFAQRLSVREQYEAYRDFGFGMPTGVSLPGEAAGRMNAPSRWTESEQASTAIGYAISVTSLQLAMAFSSVANGGEMLEPALVRQINSPSGAVLFRHTPRVLRRVMSPQTAAQLRVMLRDVESDGTATAADIALGDVAGKTGTTRLAANGGYAGGKHIATFAGMFPAQKPEFVIVVQLMEPEGMYGGATAAPVSAAVLKAAAVVTNAALDKRSLASNGARQPADAGNTVLAPASPVVQTGTSDEDFPEPEMERIAPRTIVLGSQTESQKESSLLRPVPRVAGLPLREAVFSLHSAGFRVRLSRNVASGRAVDTAPAAGAARKPGDIIVLHISR